MAEANKKRRVVKKTETVREKREKAATAAPKQRRVRQTVGKVNQPVKAAGRNIAKAASPLSFIAKPFQTKPARFVGRILSKILLLGYIHASWKELRLVTWPSRRETFKLTMAVFVFAIGFALIIAGLDYGLDKVFKQLLV